MYGVRAERRIAFAAEVRVAANRALVPPADHLFRCRVPQCSFSNPTPESRDHVGVRAAVIERETGCVYVLMVECHGSRIRG